MEARAPAITSRLRPMNRRALPRKSKFGFLRISIAPSDAERLDLALAQDPFEEELAHEVGGEHVGDQAPEQRDREALDGPGAELEQERGGNERGGVRVQDRDPDPVEAVRNR